MSAHVVHLKKGSILLRQGEESSNMYLLQEGQLKVTLNKGSKIVQLGTIYAGEMVGEMSFLDKEPRCATVEAASDCTLVEIPRDKFEDLFNELPPWFQCLNRTLCDRLRKANKFKV